MRVEQIKKIMVSLGVPFTTAASLLDRYGTAEQAIQHNTVEDPKDYPNRCLTPFPIERVMSVVAFSSTVDDEDKETCSYFGRTEYLVSATRPKELGPNHGLTEVWKPTFGITVPRGCYEISCFVTPDPPLYKFKDTTTLSRVFELIELHGITLNTAIWAGCPPEYNWSAIVLTKGTQSFEGRTAEEAIIRALSSLGEDV